MEKIGPYIVHEELGTGGMGTVFKAFDERLDRWVAIKSIFPSDKESHEHRERLRREAKAAGGINHPAVSQVYDILTEDGFDHIVMEYVEGRTLSKLIKGGALDLEQAVDIGRQVAEGLAAAHDHGVIHRDLKAENVIVTEDGCDNLNNLPEGLAWV